MTTSRSDIIVAYGDSQTAQFAWGNRLVELSGGRIVRAINRGNSGQSSGTVGVRQGGVVLTLTESVTITGTDPVDVGFQASIVPCNQRTPGIPGELGGVRGTFKIAASGSSKGAPTGTFTADNAPAETVAVQAGSEFVAEDVIDHPEYGEYLHIIWAGGNDRAYNGAGAPVGTVLAAQAQVDRLKTFVDEPRYLVLGPTVYSGEYEGSNGHLRATQARDQLAAAFPNHFVNAWEHIRDNGLTIMGIEPTEDDQAALDGKSMPPSLTSDNIHFSTDTREQVIAPLLLSELDARGWLSESSEGGTTMVTTPLNKKTGDTWDEAACATIDANFEALDSGKADAESVTALSRELDEKATTDAVNAAVDGKLDRVSGNNRVYNNGPSGEPTSLLYTAAATASTIMQRGPGGRTNVGDPESDGNATHKGYVDKAIADAVDAVSVPDVSGLATQADLDEALARIAALEAAGGGE
ncbi:MAG: hypothetical protein ACTH2Y_09105 [Corynebacterium sp.]|uniref:hypothetical protein n=1 Tax=Corynebacterium sp. TaxID=1720 RepID=UPI003F8FDECF